MTISAPISPGGLRIVSAKRSEPITAKADWSWHDLICWLISVIFPSEPGY